MTRTIALSLFLTAACAAPKVPADLTIVDADTPRHSITVGFHSWDDISLSEPMVRRGAYHATFDRATLEAILARLPLTRDRVDIDLVKVDDTPAMLEDLKHYFAALGFREVRIEPRSNDHIGLDNNATPKDGGGAFHK